MAVVGLSCGLGKATRQTSRRMWSRPNGTDSALLDQALLPSLDRGTQRTAGSQGKSLVRATILAIGFDLRTVQMVTPNEQFSGGR